MDLGLNGKRALVLGGGSGIGRGIALALAAEGANVAIVGRNLSRLEDVVDEMKEHGVKGVAVQADLNDEDSSGEIFRRTNEALGGVDVLVNNTGGPPPTAAVGIDKDLWLAQFQSMVLSVIGLTDLAIPAMREQRWGRVLTIASAGVIQPFPSLGISNALRSTLVGWSKTLATEVARDGITANVLLPATTHTNRLATVWKAQAELTGEPFEQIEAKACAALPMGRFGTVEEFGAVAAFLASVHASYITGSMIRVDGGFITSV